MKNAWLCHRGTLPIWILWHFCRFRSSHWKKAQLNGKRKKQVPSCMCIHIWNTTCCVLWMFFKLCNLKHNAHWCVDTDMHVAIYLMFCFYYLQVSIEWYFMVRTWIKRQTSHFAILSVPLIMAADWQNSTARPSLITRIFWRTLPDLTMAFFNSATPL